MDCCCEQRNNFRIAVARFFDDSTRSDVRLIDRNNTTSEAGVSELWKSGASVRPMAAPFSKTLHI
ncbi:hypothetical protein BDR04DRAFT_1088543 [Suillus decipiens]|nr:hypothetical protein BDR04DRAFT_1088543 [Suillus decipiens]